MTITREQIIAWAREADPGFEGSPDADGTMGDSIVGLQAIERFAALIEQAVRADEREQCARVCDANAQKLKYGAGHAALVVTAHDIRARRNQA